MIIIVYVCNNNYIHLTINLFKYCHMIWMNLKNHYRYQSILIYLNDILNFLSTTIHFMKVNFCF